MEGGAGAESSRTVCVTGASGFIGSWLVMRLLQRGYYVRATVRDLGNEKKVKHLLELPNAGTHLSLWKADLNVEGSFDDPIQGCQGVFHVASPMQILSSPDPENEVIKPTVNGVLSIMRSCSKANTTLKRLVYTSTIGTIMVRPQPPQTTDEYDETFWTDVHFCNSKKMTAWMYFVAKTMAEKAAWKYAEENGIDMVTIHPSLVIGPFLTPFRAFSIDIAIALYTKNEALIPLLRETRAVHVDDVCSAHIYLFQHPLAKGRYICSSHNYNIFQLANALNLKYPDHNLPIEFEGFNKSAKIIPCSSKKLTGIGFEFKYKNMDPGNLCAEAIESCRQKGLL